jgi:hypothetical protein
VISAWLQSCARLLPIAVLVALQAVAPLLHAHFGLATAHGVHMHFQSPGTPEADAFDARTSLSQGESAQAKMETGAPANPIPPALLPVTFWALVAVLLAAVLATPRIAPIARVPSLAPRWRSPNAPPPALAPPSFS